MMSKEMEGRFRVETGGGVVCLLFGWPKLPRDPQRKAQTRQTVKSRYSADTVCSLRQRCLSLNLNTRCLLPGMSSKL